MTEKQDEGLKALRVPFESHQISKLPKGKGVFLDYVGHAALTARLLDVDPFWSWEPLAFTPEGLPRLDDTGGLWIKLTVCGVTRLGYGHAASKPGPGDRIKEIIGDALRNAGMRFGMALDLWHKGGDLYGNEREQSDAAEPAAPAHPGAADRARELLTMMQSAADARSVLDVEALIKAEWEDLKSVPGFRDAVVATRTSALKRVKGANGHVSQ